MSPPPAWAIPSLWGVPLALAAGPVLLVSLEALRPPRRLRAGAGVAILGCSGLVAAAAGVHLGGTGAPVFGVLAAVLVPVVVASAVAGLNRRGRLGPGLLVLGAAAVGGVALSRASTGLLLEAEVASAIGLAWMVLGSPPAQHEAPRTLELAPGYVLGVLALQAGGDTGLRAPRDLVLTLCLLAVPLADAGLVVARRIWRGQAPWAGQPDHLSDRLTRLGASRGLGELALLALAGVLDVLAVGLTRSWVALGTGAAVAGGLVGGVALVALWGGHQLAVPSATDGRCGGRVRDADTPNPGRTRGGRPAGTGWWRWTPLAGLAVLGVLLIGPAVLAGLRARAPAAAGEVAAVAGVAAAGSGHFRTARSDLASARVDFQRAAGDLDAPWVDGGLVVPVLGGDLSAARTLVGVGSVLARSGSDLASRSQLANLQLAAGALPVHRLAELAAPLHAVVRTLRTQLARLEHLPPTYLVPQLSRALIRARGKLRTGLADAREAADIATYVPSLLGADGPRRYFLMTQDPAEARATGGFMGSWGELVVSDGHLSLPRLGRTSQLNTGGRTHRTLDAPADYLARYSQFDPAFTWQDLNMTPNFPTVGRIVANLFPQSGGVPVNGVVAIDPSGLAALLRLTGPVRIPAWPVPLSAANVVRVTTFSSYVFYAGNHAERVEFLGQVARATFQALSKLRLANLAALIGELGAAVRAHDLMVYSTAPAEEAFLTRQGVAGQVPPVRSDALQVTSQNAAGNKVDYFLHESLDYAVMLDPQIGAGGLARTALATATAQVILRNEAPPSGLPASVIGPYDPGFAAGEAREFLTIYTPLGFTGAWLDGAPVSLSSGEELGRNAYSTYVDVPAGGTVRLQVGFAGVLRLRRGGWYELDLPVQPMANPEVVQVDVRLAPAWRVTGLRGAHQVGNTGAAVVLQLRDDAAVWVRLAPQRASH